MKILPILILVVLVFPQDVFPQESADLRINHYLSGMNMKFLLPKDYTVQNSDFSFDCDAFLPPPVHYTVLKKKNNIVVGIYFGRTPTSIELRRIRNASTMFGKKGVFEPDSNYIYGTREKADTIKYKIIRFSKEFVKNRYNGDRGVEYVRNCKTPLFGTYKGHEMIILSQNQFKKDNLKPPFRIYNHNRIISISKDGIGHVELDYLYTDAVSEDEIDKEILTTSKMLRFNN